MAFILWLGLICGVFVASSPVGTISPSLGLLTSNQTSHLRPNGSPLVIVSAPSKPPFLHLGGPRSAMTSNGSRLGDDFWRCSSQSFGRPFAPGCQEAYEAFPDTPQLLTFKDRTAGSGFDIALPFRSISCEQSTWRLGHDILLSAVARLMRSQRMEKVSFKSPTKRELFPTV